MLSVSSVQPCDPICLQVRCFEIPVTSEAMQNPKKEPSLLRNDTLSKGKYYFKLSHVPDFVKKQWC